MNPDTYLHTVDVYRSINATAGKYAPEPVAVMSGIACLVEPMPSRLKASFLGTLSSAKYLMTWGEESIDAGDTILFNGRKYVIQEITDDTLRGESPYQTGVLLGVKQ